MDIAKFGLFELHLDSGELYRGGRRVPLQQQPFGVLRELVERPGGLVTRDELRRALWPDTITVDFDQALNKSVTKLRDALGDAAASPRFIETLPKRGYRFIAPVTRDGRADAAGVAEPSTPPSAPTQLDAPNFVGIDVGQPVSDRWGSGGMGVWLPATIAVVLAVASGVVMTTRRSAAAGLDAATRPTARREGPATRSPIFAARDAYERGRIAMSRRSAESLKLGIEHFARAVALSPRYAEAYVGLADGWSLLASYGLLDPREAMPRARDAANRALTLQPNLASAHASLARTAMIFDWDWRTSGWHFTRALDLESGNPTTHQWHAYYLSAIGHHDEAIAEAQRAVAAEPLSLNTNTALGYVLYLARRPDEAASQLERTLAVDPDFIQARRNLALVRVAQGRAQEAATALRRVSAQSDGSPVAHAELAWALAAAGDREQARRVLATLEETHTYVPPDSLALVHASLDDTDAALTGLRRALDLRIATLALLAVEPMWDRMRSDARFREIVTTVGAITP